MTTRLLIGNVYDREYLQVEESPIAIRIGHLAKRMLWFARAGDALLLPAMPSGPLLEHVQQTRGVDLSDSHLLATSLESEVTVNDVERAIADLDDDLVELFPWYPSKAIARFASDSGTTLHYGLAPQTVAAGSVIDLNSKIWFRSFATDLGLPIPNGLVIRRSKLPVTAQLDELLCKTGAVIVKADFCAGGVGNEILTTDVPDGNLPGGRVTRTITPESLRSNVQSMVQDGKGYVVEEYHHNHRSLFSEFIISDSGADLVCYGQQRFAGLWNGFEIGAHVLRNAPVREFLSLSQRAARAVGEKGVRGHLSIDAVVSADGALLFNELNCRIQGCTHISLLFRELAGAEYLTNLVIFTRNGVKCADFAALFRRLASANLLFSRAAMEGVILCNDCSGSHQIIEYVVCGRSISRAQALEAHVNHVLQE